MVSGDLKLQNINLCQAAVKQHNFPINFQANTTNTLEKIPEKDIVQTQKEEKKELSKLAKWGIGIGSTIAVLITTMTLISRHQTKALSKLYKEKMVFKELPEKLQFKEAKTLEEALKFAKETLGIEKIDKEISLDAMNYVNRGIVDVSNANKGKLFVPKKIKYGNISSDKHIAEVYQNIKSEDFGALCLNDRYFKNDFLNKEIKELFKYNDGQKIFTNGARDIYWGNTKAIYTPDAEFLNTLNKFYKNNNSISITQKRELLYGYWQSQAHSKNTRKYAPDRFYQEVIKKYGKQKYTLQEFKALELEKQQEILKSTLEKNPIYYTMSLDSGLNTMYHEMGHLQDFAKNLKELDLKFWDFNFIKICKEAWAEAKIEVEKGIKSPDKKRIKFIDNRWGGSTYDGYKDLLKNNPKKFEQYYPDLYKHLTDKEIQNITGQVSWYSQTSIGEFIAEVYAGLIQGKKYSDEVINLYKRYKGPLLPGM